MIRAFASGGIALAIAGAVEVFLLGTKDIVIGKSAESLNINGDVWVMPVWSLVAVPLIAGVLFFCLMLYRASSPDDDSDD